MHTILSILLITLTLIIASGCQSVDPKNPPMTLATNPNAPKDTIEKFYGARQWNHIKNLKYDAFVVLRGYVADNRTILTPRIIKSFPDNSRDGRALNFSEGIRLTPVTVGGRIRASAEIYVYFYETAIIPHQALVVAKQQSNVGPTSASGRDLFMTIVTY
ncbi:MAG: hypothetical protein LBM04_13685 [Opitutaceae bacterium]|jgi:hypothetical protein|nr:hypothetical protein [Opitutaceae bacterium]